MDELQLIERLSGPRPGQAKEAFSALSPRVCGFLRSYLKRFLLQTADLDDIIAVALAKLWAHRTEFEVRSVGAWWAYVGTVGRRCALDQLRRETDTEVLGELAEADLSLIDLAAELGQMKAHLYRLADELWLRVPPDLSDRERRQRLLAAQLYYLHGRGWREVCELVSPGRPISREQLDAWLAEEGVLAELCYRSLYIDSGELVRSILSLPASALVQVAKGQPANLPEGWTQDEARIAVWHFCNGLNAEKICQMSPALRLEEVTGTIDRVLRLLPFEACAQHLADIGARSGEFRKVLTDAGLWKRLVFQYYACDELPQKQILERTGPAAARCGYHLTAGMINVWLSNGRLVDQLAAYARRAS